MKIWSFFVLLPIISLLIAIVINPEVESKLDKKDVASVEFNNYQIYEIKENGVKDLLVAYKGRHYRDFDELEYPVYLKEQDGVYYFVGANLATIKNSVITMTKDVVYTDSDGYQLLTQMAVYDRSNALLSGNGGFLATNFGNILEGDSFLVAMDTKVFEARNIKAVYNTKE